MKGTDLDDRGVDVLPSLTFTILCIAVYLDTVVIEGKNVAVTIARQILLFLGALGQQMTSCWMSNVDEALMQRL